MKTYSIDNHTYAIHATSEQGGVWMVHFLWGKKDFRIFLERAGSSSAEAALPGTLHSEATGNLSVSRFQYLYNFEWYEYDRVSGHGLALEEVRWMRGKTRRYVELPQGFLDAAIELARREFGLARAHQGTAA